MIPLFLTAAFAGFALHDRQAMFQCRQNDFQAFFYPLGLPGRLIISEGPVGRTAAGQHGPRCLGQ
jgi:hypothetical protein